MLQYKQYQLGSDKDWIVFLHGLGGNSSIWYKQVEPFSKHFNLLFIDMYGHGETRESLPSYTFEQIGADIIKVLDHLKIDSAHFIGISLGSVVVNAITITHPKRIKQAVLGGCCIKYDIKSYVLLNIGNVLRKLMPYIWLYQFFAFIMMPKKNHALSRSIFSREARILGGKEFEKWYQLMNSLQAFNKRLELNGNKVPKLFISGGEDHLFVPTVREFCGLDTNSILHVIEKCGHICNIERADEFNRVAIDYFLILKKVPADLPEEEIYSYEPGRLAA